MRIVSDKKRLTYTIKLNDGKKYKSITLIPSVFNRLRVENTKTYQWAKIIKESNYFKNDNK